MALNLKPDAKPKLAAQPKVEIKPSEAAKIIAQIKKEKGDKVVIRGSDIPNVKRLPTGIWEFDDGIGGGFPCGRYSIIYGPESSGKTNLAYCAVARAQAGPAHCNKAVWIDLEGTFDPKWAAQFGVDVDALILVKPSYGEEAVDLVDALVRADDVAVVVVDSVAVLVSSKEIQQSVEKFDVGTAPALVKRMVNKLAIALSEEGKRDHYPAVLLINQTRFKIGVMFGDPETFPGGQALRFNSSLTVRIYGKNKADAKINPDLPIFKETSIIVKKAKVPVRRAKIEYDLCMVAHGDLGVGETKSWNDVKNQLQQFNLLVKEAKGYRLDGLLYPKLEVIQDTYVAEPAFALHLQSLVLAQKADDVFLVADPDEHQITGGASPYVQAPGQPVPPTL